MSAISAAYTVKSLPGGLLYIPMVEGTHHSSVSLTSIRRSMSDPDLPFHPPQQPPFGHPIILTVNPSTDSGGELTSVAVL